MKNETKQTAVEWLINALVRSIENLSEDECEHLSNLFQQAEEMEKQQIISAVKYGYNGHKIGHYTPNFREQQELFEQYYNETFGGK